MILLKTESYRQGKRGESRLGRFSKGDTKISLLLANKYIFNDSSSYLHTKGLHKVPCEHWLVSQCMWVPILPPSYILICILKSGLSSAVQSLHRLAPGPEGDGSFNILISALGLEGTLSKNKYIVNQNCLDILSTWYNIYQCIFYLFVVNHYSCNHPVQGNWNRAVTVLQFEGWIVERKP